MAAKGWNCDAEADARDYRNPNERKAFVAAYSDGFHGYAWGASGDDCHRFINAYGAGYWTGRGDAGLDAKKEA